MVEKTPGGLSDNDILFLLETVDPRLLTKIETLKGDPAIIEGMLDQEAGRLFRRIMLMGEEGITTRISPRLLFEVLLRKALRDMQTQSYTVERTAYRKIPVFDTREVTRLLTNKAVLRYLADMLCSFTRIQSFTTSIRIRKGIWRRVRFNDMDINSLIRYCQNLDEEHRFAAYRRIADLCLFILGMFPEYASPAPAHSPGGQPPPLRRLERSAEDYEEEGRHFYRLAGEHRDAGLLDLSEVLWQLHTNFNLAKKPLNYISETLLQFTKQKLFPQPSPN